MNAIAYCAETNRDIESLKMRPGTTWMSRNYELFSRYMQRGSERFFERLALGPGDRLLDVACGSGQLAMVAARAGIKATGCDIAASYVESGREHSAVGGLNVEFDKAAAESLPYVDGSFDVVASVAGAMFAPHPEQIVAELVRVCRPGGIIAMANWTAGSFMGQMFKTIARHIGPDGVHSPFLCQMSPLLRYRSIPDTTDATTVAEWIYSMIASFPALTTIWRTLDTNAEATGAGS